MTQNDLIAAVAAVLTTLHETNGGPESSAYLALGENLNDWHAVKAILIRAGWMTEKGNWLALTPDGTKKAKALAALFASK